MILGSEESLSRKPLLQNHIDLSSGSMSPVPTLTTPVVGETVAGVVGTLLVVATTLPVVV